MKIIIALAIIGIIIQGIFIYVEHKKIDKKSQEK